MAADRVTAWLESLERRHLADLTFQEVVRALRALSSCYVERRSKLAAGAALDTRGKRAAFALFYAPLHFRVADEVVRALGAPAIDALDSVLDLGCGTGVAGAAWARRAAARRIQGFDRNGWAVSEANRTYRELRLNGRATTGDAAKGLARAGRGSGVVLAYVVNELDAARRETLLKDLMLANARGARLLVIEPIARRLAPWWQGWERSMVDAGGRADEWRFEPDLPPLQARLARAAGLDPRELTARTLFI